MHDGITVGERIRAWREHREMTQADVAVAAGLPGPHTVCRWERGSRVLPATALYGLAHALEVSLSDLMERMPPAE